ncbi:MAG: DNA helicase RecQ [Ruminiclostridium sp.]|nr:DNA helicase RecQ [Ruminiclostridium sp.]
MQKEKILKQYFGYTTFRSGQEEIIDNILEGNDVIGIMPTGAGKSMCFQIPAMILDGITLVVSPLISLMKDQVQALRANGIPAAFINSTLTYPQMLKVLENAKTGKYKIIYIAPERLETDEFIELARGVNIAMVTVDEAHCVSQWGQNFRPSYLKIANFIENLAKRPVISAFTATATNEVREDIIELIKLKKPFIMATGFDRPNLYFEVQKPVDKYEALLKYLKENSGKCGIIYCSTRKTVEEVHDRLVRDSYSTTRYHAGLTENERSMNQEDFLYDRKTIMVATNAFGMGIDKSNVSFVIHYNMPKNLESYYQEAGRAGRDGTAADCILLYGGQDVITNQFLIDNTNENNILDVVNMEQVKEKDREHLKQMTYYCHSFDCLREYILKYFGERTTNYCGNCSNCNSNFEEMDVTVEAQKILSCITRMGQRFGIKAIIDTLRGSKGEKIIRTGLSKISTYGIMAEMTEKRIRDIINYLVLNEYILLTNSEFPVAKLTQKAKPVLFDGEKIIMKITKEEKKKIKPSKKITTESTELFSRLKALRYKLAQEKKVPAFVVFSDATLMDMCRKMPSDEKEFLEVSGVGQVKLEAYGKMFLDVLNEKV